MASAGRTAQTRPNNYLRNSVGAKYPRLVPPLRVSIKPCVQYRAFNFKVGPDLKSHYTRACHTMTVATPIGLGVRLSSHEI